jgi:beta-lysine 5,6-aminomutase alpha subunit
MSDRALSIENAQYIFRTMKDLGSELIYKDGGIIQTRANEVLTKATDLLAEIEQLGLFTTIEKGIFADVKRPKDGGKGLNGVVVKDNVYFNPFIELMKGKVAAE